MSTDAFQIAKQALRLVGRFGTPPTPKVYEVWYRFIEGADDEMLAQMEHAVNEAETVSLEFLDSMHEQFCSPVDDSREKYSKALSSEFDSFQSLIAKQATAGNEFENTIVAANSAMANETQSAEAMAKCIAILSSGTAKMQQQLAEASEQLRRSQQQVEVLQGDLLASQKRLMIDHLTGAGNRRFFDTLMRQTVGTENAQPIYLVLIDLDRFKSINDSFGHDVGDQLIRYVATQIAKERPDVSLSRIGGDEFAAFLSVSARQEIDLFTEFLKTDVGGRRFKEEHACQKVDAITMSIGAAKLRRSDDETSWYKRADSLLYEAKNCGRDCAVVED